MKRISDHTLIEPRRDTAGAVRLAPLCAAHLLIPVFIILGCGASAPPPEKTSAPPSYRYLPSGDLSSQLISTADGEVSVRLPNRWLELADDMRAPHILLWMVRDDYGASISFSPVVMDPALYKTLARDGLKSVAQVSASLKKERARDTLQIVSPPESFRIGGREYYAYEYSHDGGKTVVRVIVFDTGRRFVECALLPTRNSFSAQELKSLFEIQQGILASMVIR